MRVAYGKIGRTVEMDPAKWGTVGGDNEAPAMLERLADRNPDVTFVCMSKNRGWLPTRPNIENPWQEWAPELRKRATTLFGAKGRGDMQDFFNTIQLWDEMIVPAYDDIDQVLMWLGQHAPVNSPIPKVSNRDEWAKALVSAVLYSGHIVRGINYWRRNDPIDREEIWLNSDVRNFVKARDLKWPRRHPILTQYDYTHNARCERYGDTRTPEEFGFDAIPRDGLWDVTDQYVASGLEVVTIPDPAICLPEWREWEDRVRFGFLANQAKTDGIPAKLNRVDAVRDFVAPLQPDWIGGQWTPEGQAEVGMEISPVHYTLIGERLCSTRSTFTTPTSGSMWPTPKVWEAFSNGAVMFLHPFYDRQGHIIPTLEQIEAGWGTSSAEDEEIRHLATWLRVETPEQLQRRVDAVSTSKETYEWLRDAQFRYVTRAFKEQRALTMIEARLGIRQETAE